jgi:hypothetical protein
MQSKLSPAIARRLWQQGAAMPLDQALALAVSG